ncbi:TIGR04255 family protein [Sphingobium sp. V4]|uniref:TIGR04255 family protein n=1 Tax=Sphingobium sp. V4 TaxID=3038927 RepID=UPI002557E7F6|nr:TIGR04255 family protein [Sphingobium sp. V4]WIW88938.1 TIGR04255 family protein [Sphingobium sp. V4]
MSSVAAASFARAPINEVGFFIATKDSLVDPFGAAEIHRSLEQTYPNVERQAPVGGLELGPFLGIPPVLDPSDNGVPPRWWFVSEDETRLVQLQERFAGWNWRRRGDLNSLSTYPGYDECSQAAASYFELINEWRKSHGLENPEIVGCNLFYDNIIPFESSVEEPRRIDEVLSNWRSTWKRPTAAWQVNWLEPIGDGGPDAKEAMSVVMRLAGLMREGDPAPLSALNIQFHLTSGKTNWENLWQFFEKAHAHVRVRFDELLTEQAKAGFQGL